MINATPSSGDIVNASVTATTSGVVTVPGTRWLTANICISATLTGLGTATPRVTYTVPGGTSNAAPANGSVLHGLSVASVVGVSAQDSETMEVLVYGGDNGCTLDFNLGGASNARCTINGFLL